MARTWQVVVQGPAPTNVTTGPVREAAHGYTYCALMPGMYVISATIDGVHMRSSPTIVEASTDEAHAPLCEIQGSPLTLTTPAGAPTTLSAARVRGLHYLVLGPQRK